MSLAGIPTSPGRHPRQTSPFGRWRRSLVTMAILLLDRWLQPPLPPPPPATLSTLPTSFKLVHSACHGYDEPIAHSEKIFNHASRTWPMTVVVVEEKKRERESNRPLTTAIPLADDGDEGRWRWRSNRPVPLLSLPRPPPPLPAKYDGIIKCLGLHIQNQWLRTFDVRTGVGGWDLSPSTSDPRVCASGKRVDGSYGRGKFRGRHFKQPHCRYQLIPFLNVSFISIVSLAISRDFNLLLKS